MEMLVLETHGGWMQSMYLMLFNPNKKVRENRSFNPTSRCSQVTFLKNQKVICFEFSDWTSISKYSKLKNSKS